MGAVYKAQDMRLLRHVAIKLLRPELMMDKQKRLRFIKEAQTASSLNHPHICTIHDINEANEQHFIVMELVEGQNLREVLEAKGKLSEAEIIDISVNICDALVAVHQKGISHRDIKPENIMVTHRGLVKVMDFGLAKLATEYVESVVDMQGVRAWRQEYIDSVVDTNLSGFLGTVHYMSPEQAQGKTVDPRSDIFSFGVMLYELASGKKPFEGDSNLDILTKIIKEDAMRDLKPMGLSPGFHEILSRALQKETKHRYQSVQEVLEDLTQLKSLESGISGGTAAGGAGEVQVSSDQAGKRPGKKVLSYAMVGILVIATLGIYLKTKEGPGDGEGLMRTSRFTSFQGNESFPAFSPDGSSVAFSWDGPDQSNMDIYVKGRDGQDTTRLTTHPSPDYSPTWSSDGRYIAFVRPDPEKLRSYDLYVLPSAGGREEKLANIHPFGAIPQLCWSRDDAFIYFSKWSQPSESVAVFRVNLATKEPEQITFPPVKDVGDFSPGISPDGKHLAYIRRRMRGNYDIYVQDLEAKTTRQVSQKATEIQGYTWAGVNSILFAANLDGTSGLWKTELDGKEPQKVLSGTDISHPSYSSASKSLVYKEHVSIRDIWRLDLKDPGKQELLITSSSSENVNPQISPDGQRMAFSSDRTGTHNIWMSKVDGTEQSQLTFFDKYVRAGMARWSPVSDQVLIYFGRFQSYVMNLTTGQLVTMEDLDANPIWAKNGMDFYSCTYPETNLYFVSRDGSVKTRLTNENGYYAELEGDYLYYFKHFDQREIWRVGLDGSNEEPVLQGVEGLGISTWDVVSKGLYYLRPKHGAKMLYFYHFESGEIREICPLPGASSFTIDPEERYALYSKASNNWSDLILVEHVNIE